MIWNGKEIVTIGDLGDAMVSIFERGDKDEAERFMVVYRAATPHADVNVGYMTGYYGQGAAMRNLFGTSHPIFGMKDPTPAEAVVAGKKIAGAASD